MTIGTPKTLLESILNGLEESGSDSYSRVTAEYIEKHVHDYIANCFGMIDQEESMRVFKRIFRGSKF
jgi:phage terminase large subunit-like protein